MRRVMAVMAVMALLEGCGHGTSGSTDSASLSGAGSEGGQAGAQGKVAAAVQAQADQIFATNCAVCHGPGGRGDGPGGRFLQPKPRNFTDAKWQASVSDAHIEQVIKFGGAAVGLSPAMPAHPEFLNRPDLVEALRIHIRSLGAEGAHNQTRTGGAI